MTGDQFMSVYKADPKKLALRLGSVFVASAVPNVLVGTALDISAWKSVVMAGGVAVLNVVYNLAIAFKGDGKLTKDEVEAAFSAEAPKKKKAPAKKTAPAKKVVK